MKRRQFPGRWNFAPVELRLLRRRGDGCDEEDDKKANGASQN